MRFFSFLNKYVLIKTKIQQTSSQINNFFTLVPIQYALNTLRNEFTFQNYMEAFSLLPLLVIWKNQSAVLNQTTWSFKDWK